MSKEERRKQKQDEMRRKIFIGGLSKFTNEGKIEEVFSQFGELEDILINRGIQSRESKGCAFVLFKKEEVAQKLINLNARIVVDGHSVEIKQCYKKMKKPQIPFGNMEMFISQMIQFQQMFMGNQMSVFQRKSINEVFCENYPQFEIRGPSNVVIEHQPFGPIARSIHAFNENPNMCPNLDHPGFNTIQRPADFTFANHFQNVMNRERVDHYSHEQFINDFERCPVAKILINKSKKQSKTNLKHKETFTKIIEDLAAINLTHNKINLRFNKQILKTWAFLSKRMKIHGQKKHY